MGVWTPAHGSLCIQDMWELLQCSDHRTQSDWWSGWVWSSCSASRDCRITASLRLRGTSGTAQSQTLPKAAPTIFSPRSKLLGCVWKSPIIWEFWVGWSMEQATTVVYQIQQDDSLYFLPHWCCLLFFLFSLQLITTSVLGYFHFFAQPSQKESLNCSIQVHCHSWGCSNPYLDRAGANWDCMDACREERCWTQSA